MSPPRITIRPATEPDIPAFVKIGQRAFGKDAIAQSFFPASREPDPAKRLDDEFRWRSMRARNALRHKRRRNFVAVEGPDNAAAGETAQGETAQGPDNDDSGGGSGTIVGWAAWELMELPEGQTPMTKGELDAEFEEIARYWPASVDKDAVKSFFGVMEEEVEKIVGKNGDDGMWSKLCQSLALVNCRLTCVAALHSLAVDPAHQRKGIGRSLLDWGIETAKKENRDVSVVSSEQGRALYLGAGFEQLGSFELFGERHYPMILKSSKNAPSYGNETV